MKSLQPKKKKTLADVIFGGPSNKESHGIENIAPNNELAKLKNVQEELKQERRRNKQLTEQLLKIKTDIRTSTKIDDSTNEAVLPSLPIGEEENRPEDQLSSFKYHRFEMKINNNQFIECIACKNAIIPNQPYWRCLQCSGSVHRGCRGIVTKICIEDNGNNLAVDGSTNTANALNISPSASTDGSSTYTTEYMGDCILDISEKNVQIQINCVYEVNEAILLIGKHF